MTPDVAIKPGYRVPPVTRPRGYHVPKTQLVFERNRHKLAMCTYGHRTNSKSRQIHVLQGILSL